MIALIAQAIGPRLPTTQQSKERATVVLFISRRSTGKALDIAESGPSAKIDPTDDRPNDYSESLGADVASSPRFARKPDERMPRGINLKVMEIRLAKASQPTRQTHSYLHHQPTGRYGLARAILRSPHHKGMGMAGF